VKVIPGPPFGALAALLLVGCAPPPAVPEPAVQRTSPPPWSAPRDAVSYARMAGLAAVSPVGRIGYRVQLRLTVRVDGHMVTVPSGIGVDRVRALEAVVHTHDDSGTVWIEAPERVAVTLGQFFTVWGVRFDRRCVGWGCGKGGVTVAVDGHPVPGDPRELLLAGGTTVSVIVGG
jgi:hypothetical protein